MTAIVLLQERRYHSRALAEADIAKETSAPKKQQMKLTTLTILLGASLALGLTAEAEADVIATIGNQDDVLGCNEGAPACDSLPASLTNVGDFTFTIPTGVVVLSGSISGYFGNEDDIGVTDSTAPSDYYVDGQTIEVASCDDSQSYAAQCDTEPTPPNGPEYWTYDFTSNDLQTLDTAFENGTLDFNVIQNGFFAVNTGTTTLDLVVSPEPDSLLLLCGGAAGFALLRRLRKK